MKKQIAPEILDRLCYYASLAPSPHNAQAWRFDHKNSAIFVYLDKDRVVLRELDPRHLESRLACGAAVENIRIGAEFEGFSAQISWLPDPSQPELLARITLKRTGRRSSPELFRAMLRRQTNRSPYQKKKIPAPLLAQLKRAVKECGLELTIATRPADVSCVAHLAERAGALKFSHEATQRELHGLMRFDALSAATSRDGLDMRLFFLNKWILPLSREALKWSTMKALGPHGFASQLAKKTEADLIKSAPAVAVISAPRGNAIDFLRGGEAFERLAVLAEKAGVSLQPHSAPIEVSLSGASETPQFSGELREVFGLKESSVPIMLFRMGYASRPQPFPSARRSVSPRPTSTDLDFYSHLTARNRPVIADSDQARLANARVLVAGCGSIGGAVVECLTRLGVQNFVLAEPGSYELNNLNRQSASLTDIGRNKAEVFKERILAINPHAQVLVDTRGVAEDNVQYLAGSCDVIIDGVDVTEETGIHFKRLLHQEACRQRRATILGLDLGGAQVVHVFDYRSGDQKPFLGRVSADLSKPVGADAFLTSLISPLDLPLDFLRYTETYLRGTAGPAPQLGPTALQFGVFAAWAAHDVICGRPVRKKIRIDIARRLRPAVPGLRMDLRRLSALPKIKLLSTLPQSLRSRIP